MYEQFLILANEPVEIIDTSISNFFNERIKPRYNSASRIPIVDAFKKLLNKNNLSIIDIENKYLKKMSDSGEVDKLFQLDSKDQMILAYDMLINFSEKISQYPALKAKIIDCLKDDSYGLLLLLYFDLIPKKSFSNNKDILSILNNSDYYIKAFIDITKEPNEAIENYYKARNNYRDNSDYYRMLQRNNCVPGVYTDGTRNEENIKYFNNYRYSDLDKSTNKNIKFANDKEALDRFKGGQASLDEILQYAKLIAKKTDWKELEDLLLDNYRAGTLSSFQNIQRYILLMLKKQRWQEFEDALLDRLSTQKDSKSIEHFYRYWNNIDKNQDALDYFKDFVLHLYENNEISYNLISKLLSKGQTWDYLENAILNKLDSSNNIKEYFNDYLSYITYTKHVDEKKLKDILLKLYDKDILSYSQIKDYLDMYNFNRDWDEFLDAIKNKKDFTNYVDYYIYSNKPITNQEILDLYEDPDNNIKSIEPLITYLQKSQEPFPEIQDIVFKRFVDKVWKWDDFEAYIPQLLKNGRWENLENYLKRDLNKYHDKFETLLKFMGVSAQDIANKFEDYYMGDYVSGKIKATDVINFITQYKNPRESDKILSRFFNKNDVDGVLSYLENCDVKNNSSVHKNIENFIIKNIEDLNKSDKRQELFNRYIQALNTKGLSALDKRLQNANPSMLITQSDRYKDQLDSNMSNYRNLISDFYKYYRMNTSSDLIKLMGFDEKNSKFENHDFYNLLNAAKGLDKLKIKSLKESTQDESKQRYYDMLIKLLDIFENNSSSIIENLIDKISERIGTLLTNYTNMKKQNPNNPELSKLEQNIKELSTFLYNMGDLRYFNLTANKNRGNNMNRIVKAYTRYYIKNFLPGLVRKASPDMLPTVIDTGVNEVNNLMYSNMPLERGLDYYHNPNVINQIKTDITNAVNNKDLLDGGASDGLSIEDIAKKWSPIYKIPYQQMLDILKTQEQAGSIVEQEHTTNLEIAKEIARDHLVEAPDYYSHLENMEEDFPAEDVAVKPLMEPENMDLKILNNPLPKDHVCDGSCGGNCQCHTEEQIQPMTVEDKLSNLGDNIIVTVVSEPEEIQPINDDEVKVVDYINNIAANIKR